MKYSVEYLPDKKIVDIKTKGRINFHIAETYSKEAIRLAREKGCTKFLIEHNAFSFSLEKQNEVLHLFIPEKFSWGIFWIGEIVTAFTIVLIFRRLMVSAVRRVGI